MIKTIVLSVDPMLKPMLQLICLRQWRRQLEPMVNLAHALFDFLKERKMENKSICNYDLIL